MKFDDIKRLPEGTRVIVEKGDMRAIMTLVAADKYAQGKCVVVQLDDGRFRRYRPCHIVEVTGEMRAVTHDHAHAEIDLPKDVDAPFADFIKEVEKHNGSR